MSIRPALLALLLLLTGCLPSSQRVEKEALFPADSLSRQRAQTMPVDSLELRWQSTGPEGAAMQYPASVQYGRDSLLYVADARLGRLYVLDEAGQTVRTVEDDRLRFAYLSGARGDSVALLSRGESAVLFVHGGEIVGTQPVPDAPNATAWVDDEQVYFKTMDKKAGGYLARLDASGQPTTPRAELPPNEFRYLGFLRTSGDTLFSLSGLRPVIDRLHPDGTLDSLTLVGFDSPQLNRSRLFLLGEVDEPPRLSSSAAVADSLFFVLNLRAGWLRVDVYDRSGQLQHILEQRGQQYDRSFYPLDLAVRLVDGGYEFAVVTSKPRPQVRMYRWIKKEPTTD